MLFTIIIFFAVLAVMVFVHELGHFFTARKLGVKAEEFGFGLPPRIGGWKKVGGKWKFFLGNQPPEEIQSEDTIYSLNWLPVGGFVKIKGENGEGVSDPDSFANKKIWKRAMILSAGVIMNVVLCFFCLSLAFFIGAPQFVDEPKAGLAVVDQKIQIVAVVKDSPAEKAGLAVGDALLEIDGQKFAAIAAVQEFVGAREGKILPIVIDRFGERKEFAVAPVKLTETGKAGFGVGLATSGIVSYPWYAAIWLGLKSTLFLAWQIILAFYTLIKNAIVGLPLGVDLAGPVGIAVMTGKVARLGFVHILQFTALLSMNLAIINFLPFPALDGGRILFLIIEKIKGKAVNQKVEQIAHTIGFALLMILIVIVTGRDFFKFKDSFINLWHKIIS